MPQLKQLSCTVQWADTGTPFQEYGTVYGDGLVETFIAVPSKPQLFTIHLKSLKYIYEGLAVVVFIDGNYQANRNRVNLKPFKKDRPLNDTQIDFLLRQKEKPIGEGVYMGREWRFDNHNIVDELPKGVKQTHFDLLGTLEILILRCRTRFSEEFDESGSSSGADSDALGHKGERQVVEEAAVENVVKNKGKDNSKKLANRDGPEEKKDAESRVADLSSSMDGSVESNYHFSLDGPTDGSHGYAGPPPWNPTYVYHHRTHSQHGQTGQAPQDRTSRMVSPQQNHGQGGNTHEPQKQVRFDTGTQHSQTEPQLPIPTPPRPQSRERMRPTSYVYERPPPNNDNVHHSQPAPVLLTSGPVVLPPASYIAPSQPYNYQYQQQRHAIPPTYNAAPQPALPSINTPVAQPMVQMAYHVPHHSQVVVSQGNPYYQPLWPAQPPHSIHYPYQHGQNVFWPTYPGRKYVFLPPNSNPAARADSSDNSNKGSVDPSQAANESQNNDTNVGGSWQRNWGDNAGKDSQANDNSTVQSSDSQGQPPVVDKVSSGGNGIEADGENQGSNNGDDEADNNDGDQPDGQVDDGWGNNDNASNGVQQDVPKTVRALYGPHGQYLTYNPRGPDDPEPDAEEEPRYDVPKEIAEARGSTKQVLPGSGYMYWKKRRAPEYIDTLDEPYARFVFKYRTKEQLEDEIGIKIDVEPTGDEAMQELQNMDKQALVDMLMRAKGALGGKIPSPPLRPAVPMTESLVGVDPPENLFLQYKLPESGRAVGKSAGNVTKTNKRTNASAGQASGGGGGGGGGGESDWNTPSNDNDTTEATNGINWNEPSKSSKKNSGFAAPSNPNPGANWNRAIIDGTAEPQLKGPNTTAPNNHLSDRNTTGPISLPFQSSPQQGSIHSSPSILPLEPFNSDSAVPPVPYIPTGPSGPFQFPDSSGNANTQW